MGEGELALLADALPAQRVAAGEIGPCPARASDAASTRPAGSSTCTTVRSRADGRRAASSPPVPDTATATWAARSAAAVLMLSNRMPRATTSSTPPASTEATATTTAAARADLRRTPRWRRNGSSMTATLTAVRVPGAAPAFRDSSAPGQQPAPPWRAIRARSSSSRRASARATTERRPNSPAGFQQAGIPVERHDFLELLPPGWGRTLKQTYARQLATVPATWGWLLNAAGGPRGTRSAAWLSERAVRERLLAVVGPGTRAVVSTYPLASQALGRLRTAGWLPMPAYAVMTDPSVHPLCVAPGIDLHLAPNEDATARITHGFGLAAATNAPIVDPAFRTGDVEDARSRLGLPRTERLVLIVAGSWGVGDIAATVRDVAAATDAIPVVVCGRNNRLRDQLARTGRVIALGWVDDMPSLLRAADVVVHNAGGLSSLEAMATGVPVISYRCLPGHGVANAEVLARIGLSPWPRTPLELAATIGAALSGGLAGPQQSAFAGLRTAREASGLIVGAPFSDFLGRDRESVRVDHAVPLA